MQILISRRVETVYTAGVFLIIRSGPLFEGSSLVLTVVTFLGALTAFFAATTGVVQNDLKKVIAYSTCSQLGYMVMACGVSNYCRLVFSEHKSACTQFQ